MCEDLGLLQQDRWQIIYSSHKAEGSSSLRSSTLTDIMGRKMMCDDLALLQQDRWQYIYRSHKAEGRARLLAALRQILTPSTHKWRRREGSTNVLRRSGFQPVSSPGETSSFRGTPSGNASPHRRGACKQPTALHTAPFTETTSLEQGRLIGSQGGTSVVGH
jgi:hypothetical protein